MNLLYITTSPQQLTLWLLLWFSFVFNDARLQESSFKSRKSTTSMNSINAFADIRVRYPKINEIFKVCQLLCCAQNIVHHYYSYSQKLSNWALLSITTIIRWKEKGHAHIYLSNCWVFCSAYKLNISCKVRLPWATIPFFVFRISLGCKTFP